jgi:hypothetical protein
MHPGNYSTLYTLQNIVLYCRSDAQKAAQQKELKEKELELCSFNAEHMDDSGHGHQSRVGAGAV